MIKLISLFLLLVNFANAGLPPTTVKDSLDATDKTTFQFRFPNFTGAHTGVSYSLGVNSIAGGGTGQATKAAAFDALSPMTTQYDLIIGGASGTGIRKGKGTDNTHLTTIGGVVDWTSDPSPYSIVTISSNTNAVCGTTYWCDTSGGAFTVTLPSPVANCFVGIFDAAGTFDTNNLTIAPFATDKIMYVNANYVVNAYGFARNLLTNGTDWLFQ